MKRNSCTYTQNKLRKGNQSLSLFVVVDQISLRDAKVCIDVKYAAAGLHLFDDVVDFVGRKLLILADFF